MKGLEIVLFLMGFIMGKLFDLVAGKAALPIMGVLLAAMLGLWTYYGIQVFALEKNIKDLRIKEGQLITQNSSYVSQITNMKEALNSQTQAVENLLMAQVEKEKAAAEQLAKVKAFGETWKKKFDSIFVPSKAKTLPAQCIELDKLFDSYIDLRKQQLTKGVQP